MVAVKYAFTNFDNNGRCMWKLSSIWWEYITMMIAQTIKDSSNFVLIQCWIEPDGKDIIDHTVWIPKCSLFITPYFWDDDFAALQEKINIIYLKVS